LNISGTVTIGPTNATSATSTFKLTNSAANITVNTIGALNLNMPSDSGSLVDNTGTSASINNNGTVSLVNSPGNTQAYVYAPLENHATLYANQGGTWNFGTADGNKNDISMDAGKIVLAKSTALQFEHGYTQTGGTLEITDNTTSNGLIGINPGGGAANFNGGKTVFDSTTGYGQLTVNDVIFDGVEIDMRIDGITNASDRITCWQGKTCNITGNSKLVVTAKNQVVKGSGITWTLISDISGDSSITGDFLAFNITLPTNVVESAWAPPRKSWECNS
jgi:hypothetical protein